MFDYERILYQGPNTIPDTLTVINNLKHMVEILPDVAYPFQG